MWTFKPLSMSTNSKCIKHLKQPLIKLVAALKVQFCPCAQINESRDIRIINEYAVTGYLNFFSSSITLFISSIVIQESCFNPLQVTISLILKPLITIGSSTASK